jgi:CDP-4-dehydro-6-deoxyglucose reductase
MEEAGISEDEKRQGIILTCCRSAESVVDLDTPEVLDYQIPTTSALPCKIANISRPASDIIRVWLRFPPTVDFKFLPGQYVDIKLSDGTKRSYSISSDDFSERQIEIQIKKVNNGKMSHYWFSQAKIGDLLYLNGPLGTFFLRPSKNIDLVFLATGTGIAPVKSIVDSITKLGEGQRPRSVSIFWGNNYNEGFYLDRTVFPASAKIFMVHSRPNVGWEDQIGYVQNAWLAMKPDISNTTVYACGSSSMIKSAKALLLNAGLPEIRFLSDAFVESGN